MDHAALFVDFSIFEQQVVAPVVEHQQTRVDNTLTLQWGGADVIHRLIDRGVGIQVGAEFHANGLTPRHNAQFLALAREVLCAVEGHVFQEVCQSALTGFLQYRTHALGNVEVGQTCLFCIVTDVVGHAVFQLTLADSGVLWQLCRRLKRQQQRQHTQQIFLHLLYGFISTAKRVPRA